MRGIGSNGGREVQVAARALAGLVAATGLSGCIVAGYSSGSGLWIWPGSIVITLVLLLLYFLMRHR